MSAAGRLDWLRLIRSENVGPIVFHQLLNQFGTAGAALDALPDLARRGGGGRRMIRVCTPAAAAAELEAAAAVGARPLASCEVAYPSRLGALPDPSSGGIVIDLAVTCDSAPSVGTHGINQGKENEGVIGDRLVSPARVNLQGIERISVSLTRITIG